MITITVVTSNTFKITIASAGLMQRRPQERTGSWYASVMPGCMGAASGGASPEDAAIAAAYC
jgi:hypothetical protein